MIKLTVDGHPIPESVADGDMIRDERHARGHVDYADGLGTTVGLPVVSDVVDRGPTAIRRERHVPWKEADPKIFSDENPSVFTYIEQNGFMCRRFGRDRVPPVGGDSDRANGILRRYCGQRSNSTGAVTLEIARIMQHASERSRFVSEQMIAHRDGRR